MGKEQAESSGITRSCSGSWEKLRGHECLREGTGEGGCRIIKQNGRKLIKIRRQMIPAETAHA